MTEPRVLRGRWWLANNPDDEGLPGTLTLDGDQPYRLDLDGALLPDPALRTSVWRREASLPMDRILGLTEDREHITLEGCQLAGYGTRSTRGRPVSEHESYWVDVILAGAWFPADEPVLFDVATVQLSSLHAWTAMSGFEPMWQIAVPDDAGTYVQKYEPPPEQRAHLGDGTVLRLAFPLDERTEGLLTYQKTFTQDTRFVFEFSEPRPVEALKPLVFTLRNFLTLAVGESVSVLTLAGYRKPLPGDDPPIGRNARINYQQVTKAQAREVPHHHFMLFTLRDIADRFEEHMRLWFDHVPGLKRVLDLYFSALHTDLVYLETRFMNLAEALEGYHRIRLSRNLYEDATWTEITATILNGTTGRARRIAKKALRYANEPSLEERMSDVLELLGDPARGVLLAGKSDAASFARRVAQIRNTYAHNLPAETPGTQELDLYTTGLEVLVEALLLLETGFTHQQIDEMQTHARRFEFMSNVRKHGE